MRRSVIVITFPLPILYSWLLLQYHQKVITTTKNAIDAPETASNIVPTQATEVDTAESDTVRIQTSELEQVHETETEPHGRCW